MNTPQTHHTLLTALVALVASASSLAVHAQVPAAAPSSTVTVYGLIDAAARRASNVTAAGGSNADLEDGIFTGSRWGLRGREELGGGMQAFFSLEAGFDPSTGATSQGTTTADYGQAATSRIFGREALVGLGGTWGAVMLGRQYTVAHLMAARFQPLGNPNNAALSVFSSHHIARQDNVAKVETKLGDVTLTAGYTFGGQPTTSANSSTALSALYAKGDVTFGGYLQHMKNLAGTETRKIVGLGGNVRLTKDLVAFGGFMQRSAELSAQKNRVWNLGANYELTPQVQLSAAYLSDDQSGSAALDGARKVAYVTASYKFSRRTDVYGVIDSNDVTGGYTKPAFMGTKGRQTAFSAGLRHRF